MAAAEKPWDRYDGPLRRADGAAPEHVHHFRPMEGDRYYFKHPWAITDLYVVPLNDGTWLANKAGTTTYTKTTFPSREAAFLHEAFVACRMLRSRALARRYLRAPVMAKKYFDPINRGDQAKQQRWLYSVFRKELGNRRRWRRYGAICTAVILHERALDQLQQLENSFSFKAREGFGWPPTRGKKLIDKYWDAVEAEADKIRERRSGEVVRAMLKVSHFMMRVERLKGRA